MMLDLTHWQQGFHGAQAASAGCGISLQLRNVGNIAGAEVPGTRRSRLLPPHLSLFPLLFD